MFTKPDHPDRVAPAAGPDHCPPGLAALGPTWRLYAEYWRMVRRHVPERRERLRCYARLIGWLAVNRNLARLLQEPFGGLDPLARASEAGRRLRLAVRGPRAADLSLRQR